ncbi:hypothetical protein SISSUDRAFT_458555 [Sistotremastrum suecicum HHB10207 ss-3]|uniref:Uncharacterized protein n=1 Tax=Sistotremastrum suecicum HHB10207 ss-3 TaxID=1314776 RepID=A0A165Y6V4_9AGAM|nr:hypothetical protein SISSUDRAFT_458555 [Sistotremastrum suecicum HHB10207 ss-3]
MDRCNLLNVPPFCVVRLDHRAEELRTYRERCDLDASLCQTKMKISFIGEVSLFSAASVLLGLPFDTDIKLGCPLIVDVVSPADYEPQQINVSVIQSHGPDGTLAEKPITHFIGSSRNMEDIRALVFHAHSTVQKLRDVYMASPTIPQGASSTSSSGLLPGLLYSHNKIHVEFRVFRAPVELTATFYPRCSSPWWKDALAGGSPSFTPGNSTCIGVLDYEPAEQLAHNVLTLSKVSILDPKGDHSLVVSFSDDIKDVSLQQLRDAQLPKVKFFTLPPLLDRMARAAADFDSMTIDPGREGSIFSKQLKTLWEVLHAVYKSQTSMVEERLWDCRSIVLRRLQHSKAILAQMNNLLPDVARAELEEADQQPFETACNSVLEGFDNELEGIETVFYIANSPYTWFSPIPSEEAFHYFKSTPLDAFTPNALSLPDNQDIIFAKELQHDENP